MIFSPYFKQGENIYTSNLKNLYSKDKSAKNKRALDRILEHYAEDINYLKNLCFAKNINSIEIAEIDYKLIDYIDTFNS